MCRFTSYKEIIGSSEPMIPGDELDVPSGEQQKTKTEGSVNTDSKTETVATPAETVSEGSGMGFLAKAVFFLIICCGIFAFLKTRKAPGTTDKSLA